MLVIEMRLHLECLACNIQQVIKIMNILQIAPNTREEIMSDVLAMLSQVDYQKCNPEVMYDTWQVIVKHTGNDNPYQAIAKYYNTEVMKIVPNIENMIHTSDDCLKTALKVAIAGNLIDFASKHTFDLSMLIKQVERIQKQTIARDDSEKLFTKLQNAKTVLYLGDNCGEIVLDKLFIKILKEHMNIDVYYGCRGQAIVNDVTLADCAFVKMEEVATVIDNGDGSLGTVLAKTSLAFQEVFNNADVIIAKGQGNYESLMEVTRNNIFHLFMVKCEVIASHVGVLQGDIVCVENKGEE